MLHDLADFVRSMLNFQGINWWTLLSGIGLNFIITTFASLGGTYLATNEATASFYTRFGPILMLLILFASYVLAGFITAKIADDVPTKHSFLSSLGAVFPLIFAGVLAFNPFLIMLALVAVAGNMNGGMLAISRSRRQPPHS